jgi:hypothetical protein
MTIHKLTNKSISRRFTLTQIFSLAFASLLIPSIFATDNHLPIANAQESNSFKHDSNNTIKCRNSSIAGRYAVRGDGFVPGGPPPAPFVPFAIVSLMTLDRDGTLSNDVTVSRNGVISRNVDPGTFNINADCTGTMTINISEPPFVLNFDLVVVDKRDEFYAIATTPSIVTFSGKRLE